MSRLAVILVCTAALIIGGVLGGVAVGTTAFAPARVVLRYPWPLLASEAKTMHECAGCHKPAELHTCDTCHDEHGSAEMAGVPFNGLILLVGDVPEPGYLAVNDILPYRDQPNTHITLLDLLEQQGVTQFESVTLASRDGGLVTVERPNLTAEALLLPYADGVRFAAENLHVSTWLKGVWRIIVVGPARPLTINGQTTSIGRLLLGPTRSVTVEQTNVMLKSGADGQVRTGKTASRVEGAAVADLVAYPGFQTLIVRDAAGQEHHVDAADAAGALLAQVRGRLTLVLPGRGRAQWVTDVVEIISR